MDLLREAYEQMRQEITDLREEDPRFSRWLAGMGSPKESTLNVRDAWRDLKGEEQEWPEVDQPYWGTEFAESGVTANPSTNGSSGHPVAKPCQP